MVRLILIAVVMASAVVVALGAPVPDVKPQAKPKVTAANDYAACMKAVEKGNVVTLNHGVYHGCDYYTNPSDPDWKNIPYGVYICYQNVEDGKPTMKRVELDHRVEPSATATATRQPVFPAIQQLFPRLAPASSCGPGGCPQPWTVPGFRSR